METPEIKIDFDYPLSGLRIKANIRTHIVKIVDDSATGKTYFYNAIRSRVRSQKESPARIGGQEIEVQCFSGEDNLSDEEIAHKLSSKNSLILVDEGDLIFGKNKKLYEPVIDNLLNNGGSYYVFIMRGVHTELPISINEKAVIRVKDGEMELVYYKDL